MESHDPVDLNIVKRRQFTIETKERKFEGLNKDLQGEWNGPFTFIQAADTQFGLIDRYISKKTDNDIKWAKEIHYLRLFIEKVNKLVPTPKFIVICGDLVDAFPLPYSKFPHPDIQKLRKSQVADLKAILCELDPAIKLVCVCGNHDVGDKPTEESIDIYKKDFGDDYFSFWHSGCKFITLNSQLYYDSSEIPEQKKEQDKWLQNELAADSDQKHLVIFQHIPLFFESPDEPTHAYFNIEIEQRKKLIEKFKEAGVKKVFCGHYHRNAGGFDGDFECIVTSAIGAQLGDDGHGFRLVEVTENDIKHQYIKVSDEVN